MAFLALEHQVASRLPFLGRNRARRQRNRRSRFHYAARRHAKQDKHAAAEGSVPHNHTRGSYDASDKIQGLTPSWHALDPGRQAAGAIYTAVETC